MVRQLGAVDLPAFLLYRRQSFCTCINILNLISDLTKTATCSDTNELLFTAAVEEVQSPLRAVTSTPEKSHFKVRAQRTGASDLLTLVIINSVSGLTAAAASYQRQGWEGGTVGGVTLSIPAPKENGGCPQVNPPESKTSGRIVIKGGGGGQGGGTNCKNVGQSN